MNSRHHLARLDILRGAGALLVLYSHFFDGFASSKNIGAWPLFASVLPEGKVGVALFCVISGFIFEYLVDGRRVNYGRFIAARMWRIYPLYITILILSVAVFGSSAIALVVQAVAMVPAFDPGDIWMQSWSLVIEFQFYLVFPFLTLIFAREGMRQLLLIAAFFLTMRALLWAIDKNVNAVAYNTMLGRASQFIAGMIAARLFAQGRARVAANPMFLLLCIVALAASIHHYHVEFGAQHPYFDVPYRSIYAVLWPDVQALLFAALTLSFLELPRRRVPWAGAAFSFVGKVSFSLYLTHRMIEYVIARATDFHIPFQPTGSIRFDGFIFCTVVEVPAAIALATLTYYAIEKPFQGFKKEYVEPGSPRPVESPQPDGMTPHLLSDRPGGGGQSLAFKERGPE